MSRTSDKRKGTQQLKGVDSTVPFTFGLAPRLLDLLPSFHLFSGGVEEDVVLTSSRASALAMAEGIFTFEIEFALIEDSATSFFIMATSLLVRLSSSFRVSMLKENLARMSSSYAMILSKRLLVWIMKSPNVLSTVRSLTPWVITISTTVVG
ncbi:unnamed protein product [Citrullus colocynthis]|uniref:Uncharacterized protein n=1 Tax=Citrullus colocynthis TaxID=252529 RepID=A0ABP0ZA02_9ROSI